MPGVAFLSGRPRFLYGLRWFVLNNRLLNSFAEREIGSDTYLFSFCVRAFNSHIYMYKIILDYIRALTVFYMKKHSVSAVPLD
jgi:hypothetical protein